jgi:hypothetical protein
MKLNWKRAVMVALALTLSLSQVAAAQGRGNGKSGNGKPDSGKAPKVEAGEKHDRGVDRDGHRRIVGDYFLRQSLPPGLAKRQSLPPGLAKQLRERGTLPPGLRKHLVEVPAPLLVRLPPVPGIYHRYFIGRDLIVVDTVSNLVVTILRDVLS